MGACLPMRGGSAKPSETAAPTTDDIQLFVVFAKAARTVNLVAPYVLYKHCRSIDRIVWPPESGQDLHIVTQHVPYRSVAQYFYMPSISLLVTNKK